MKKSFITGLIILLPIAITIAILGFLVNLFTHPFVGFVSSCLEKLQWAQNGFLFLTPDQVVKYLSKLLILICLFFVIVILGILGRWFAISWILTLGDRLLKKIPVVNTVYVSTKEIIQSFFSSDKMTFKKVVLAPFPRKGMHALGLVTSDAPQAFTDGLGSPVISVFIPTTPNPLTGFILMYPQKDLVYLDMKAETAMKYILSCGVLSTETWRS